MMFPPRWSVLYKYIPQRVACFFAVYKGYRVLVVNLVQVWPSRHDSGPISVCLRSRSSSPPLHICPAPPTTKASTAISNIFLFPTCILTISPKWNTKQRYHDDSLLLVILLSQSLGDNFDHNVGLQPVICPDWLLLLLLLLLHLNKKHRNSIENTLWE